MMSENPDESFPTWSEPFMIGQGVMMNKPTVTKSGDWLFPLSNWEGRRLPSEGVATAGTLISRDHGRTFEALGAVYVPVEHRQFDEHMFVEQKDGGLWAWVRTRYGIGTAKSQDGGRTWSKLQPSELKHPVTRFFIRRLQSGNLLLVKHGPLDEQIGRSHLTAYVSADDGLTWEGGLLLDERHCSYPDGFQAEDGRIYIIYDRSRQGEKQINMAVFTEEDAVAGQEVSGNMRTRIIVNQATGSVPLGIDFHPNEDGEKLLKGTAAEWTVADGGSVDWFTLGTRVFTDRGYKLENLPEELINSRFIRSSLKQTEVVCQKAGIVYVITPSKGRNKDSLHDELLELGFVKVAIPEFLLFKGSKPSANTCSIYQKKVTVGERLSWGAWGVLVIPAS